MYYQTHNLDVIYYEPTNIECIICFQNDFIFPNYTTLKTFNYQKSISGCECNHFIHKTCINKWYDSIPIDTSYKCILCNRESSQIDVLNFIMLKKKLFYMIYFILKIINVFIFSFLYLTLFLFISNIWALYIFLV